MIVSIDAKKAFDKIQSFFDKNSQIDYRIIVQHNKDQI